MSFPAAFPRPAVLLSLAALVLSLSVILALLLSSGPAHGQTDDTPPTVASATVDGARLTVTFSEPLRATSTAGMQFAIWADGIIDGASVSPASVSINGKTLTINLGTAASAGQTVTVNYDATYPDEPLQDAAGNRVASFYGQAVRNAASATPRTHPRTYAGTHAGAYAGTHAGAYARTDTGTHAGTHPPNRPRNRPPNPRRNRQPNPPPHRSRNSRPSPRA